MAYIILRGRWCLNVNAPTEDKIVEVKGCFYEELECVFHTFPKWHDIFFGNVNAKVGSEVIFKQTIGSAGFHEINIDNGVGVVNFATSQNLTVKSTMFPRRNIHKFTWNNSWWKYSTLHRPHYHLKETVFKCTWCLIVQDSSVIMDYYLVVAEVRDRLALSKQKTT
jgi:hypothetical protein